MLRAYLIPASLAAALTEVGAILTLMLFRVSEQAFHSLTFRVMSAVIIATAVVLTRQRAYRAFRAAVDARFVSYHDSNEQTLYLSPACPEREWVMLHLRFRRIAFRLASLESRSVWSGMH